MMFTRFRRQLIQRRLPSARTLVGRSRGEFLSVILFGYLLPLVWTIGVAVAYLRLAR